MWPTFYIPSAVIIPGDTGTGELDYMCGVVSASGTPRVLTVPTPATIQDGDLHLVIATYDTNRTYTFPTGGTDGFYLVTDLGRFPFIGGTSLASPRQLVFLRQYTTGQPDFTVTGPSGFMNLAYVSVILRNPNVADPILSAGHYSFGEGAAGLGAHAGEITGLSSVRPGDVVLFINGAGGQSHLETPPDAADVEFVCQNFTGTFIGHTVAATYASQGASNLLKYSRTLDPSAWTYVNITRSINQTYGASKVDAKLTMDATTGRHYIEQSVDLTAGDTYWFCIAGLATDYGADQTCMHLTYVKPDNSEHGYGFRVSAANTTQYQTGTEVDTTGSPMPGWVGDEGDLLQVGGGMFFIPIVCDTTGTYKIRINMTKGIPIGDPTASSAGSTSAAWWHADCVLQKGYSVGYIPCFVPTTSSPILPGDVDFELVPVSDPSPTSLIDNRYYSFLILRRNTSLQDRPACKLVHYGAGGRDFTIASDGLSLETTRFRYEASGNNYTCLQSSHAVNRLLAGGKYYWEVSLDTFSAGIDDDYFIGFSVAESGAVSRTDYLTQPYKYAYQYGYSSTGKVYESGTLLGSGYTTWSAGDKIGASIDLVNWQIKFYRNGTLIETCSIAADTRRDALWVGTCGMTGPNTYTDESVITANFKGPFSGRKPSGFVAYDFDNEVA